MTGSKFNDSEVNSHLITLDRNLSDKFRKINSERLRNYDMTVSRLQWSEDDKAELDEQGRPAYSYNLISPIIKAIAGIERAGRKKVSIVGRTGDDQAGSQIMTQVLDWCYSQTSYDFQKSKAVLDALIARWGVLRTAYQYDDDPLGMLTVKRVNPFRIKYDMDFTDIQMKDCRYLMDTAWYTQEEILQMFALNNNDMWEEIVSKGNAFFTPEYNKPKGLVSTFMSRLMGNISSRKNSLSVNPDLSEWFDQQSSRFKVLELHERRLTRKMNLFDPSTNNNFDITDHVKPEKANASGYDNDKLQEIRGRFTDPRVSQITAKEIWVTTSIPAFDMKIQDVPYKIQNGNFEYTLVFAYDFHADIMNTQSLVDELVDPQSSYNKRRSTMLEYVTRFSAVGYVLEEGVNEGFESEWTDKKIGGIRHVKRGMMDKWKTDAPPQMPPALAQFEQEEESMLQKISGISQANKGQTEAANETGKLFLAKKQQGEVMMQYFFDNIEFAMIQVARNAIDNIQYFMTEQRVIRIAGDAEDPEYLTINQRTINGLVNDLSQSKYDLEVSSMPYGSTAREVQFTKLIDMFNFIVNANPQLAVKMLPVVLEASDTPYRRKLIEVINNELKSQDQAAQAQQGMMGQMQNVDMAKKTAETKKVDNENWLDEVAKGGINAMLNK